MVSELKFCVAGFALLSLAICSCNSMPFSDSRENRAFQRVIRRLMNDPESQRLLDPRQERGIQELNSYEAVRTRRGGSPPSNPLRGVGLVQFESLRRQYQQDMERRRLEQEAKQNEKNQEYFSTIG